MLCEDQWTHLNLCCNSVPARGYTDLSRICTLHTNFRRIPTKNKLLYHIVCVLNNCQGELPLQFVLYQQPEAVFAHDEAHNEAQLP